MLSDSELASFTSVYCECIISNYCLSVSNLIIIDAVSYSHYDETLAHSLALHGKSSSLFRIVYVGKNIVGGGG